MNTTASQYPVIRETWLSQKVNPSGYTVTVMMTMLLLITSLITFGGPEYWAQLLPANWNMIFMDHQYWRLFSTLFVHADWAHLLSNLILFVPFSYFLTGYFGVLFFPVAGLLAGALTNLIVIMTLREHTHLIGLSGVVYWMGAAWLTLLLLIDRKQSLRRRIAKVLVIAAVLFFPETYKPEVSYLSHLVGFILGIASAWVYFLFHRNRFRSAEKTEWVIDEDLNLPTESNESLTPLSDSNRI